MYIGTLLEKLETSVFAKKEYLTNMCGRLFSFMANNLQLVALVSYIILILINFIVSNTNLINDK